MPHYFALAGVCTLQRIGVVGLERDVVCVGNALPHECYAVVVDGAGVVLSDGEWFLIVDTFFVFEAGAEVVAMLFDVGKSVVGSAVELFAEYPSARNVSHKSRCQDAYKMVKRNQNQRFFTINSIPSSELTSDMERMIRNP